MKHTILSTTGKTASVELPDSLFAAKINPALMAQAVRIYLGNQRQAGAKTKTRGEVSLTTKKWYRQKGTGRARHGAQSAPLFVGGGVSHGPDGDQNYKRTMPQNMRRAALASALTQKLQDKKITVVDAVSSISQSKQAIELLSKFSLSGRITLVLSEYTPDIVRAFRNLDDVTVLYANMLHTYAVLNGGTLVFIPEAVEKLTKTFTKKTVANKAESVKEETKSAETEEKTPKAPVKKAAAKTTKETKAPSEKTTKTTKSKTK